MILGRPVNLILGAITAIFNVVVVASQTIPIPSLQPILNETLVPIINIAIAALITLIANQPPTVAAGDTVKVVTAAGEPNKTVTVG